MEQDYKLVENEGLFQEYLEMGKNLPNNTDVLERRAKYCLHRRLISADWL
jgi:hypothetical protein